MVGVSYDRRAILVTWDPGEYEGQVRLVFTNPGDLSDISNTDLRANDGEGVATVPSSFSGEINARVETAEGDTLDEGVISI